MAIFYCKGVRALKKLNKEKVKDILVRAGKTFVQAFFSSVVVENFLVVKDAETLKVVLASTLIAGAAAGVSAVWNMLVNLINK